MKTVSDVQIGNVAAGIMAISKNLPESMSKQAKLATSKKIAAAVLKSSVRDLEGHTPVNNVILKQAGHEILSAVSDTWVGKGIRSPTRSPNPGTSLGNAPANDPPSLASQMDQASCEAALEKSGITDPDFRKQTCSTYLQQTPDTSALDPNQKGAHLVNASNNWLTTYDQLFSGGPISRPKYRAETLENTPKQESKSAAVVQNQPEYPAWLKATVGYRASNHSTEDLERAKLKTAKTRALKEASMDVKKPAGVRAIEAFHGR